MKKIKYQQYVTKKGIDSIILERFPEYKCPECGKKGVYAGCIEDQYDEKSDEYIILSFDLFCKECGAVLGKWDNTDREYLFGQRKSW